MLCTFSSVSRGFSDEDPFTRREFVLRSAGGLVALGAGTSAVDRMLRGGDARVLSSSQRHESARIYVSRPGLRPPVVAARGAGARGEYTFVGPHAAGRSQPGALVLDGKGETVWFSPLPAGKWATNLRAGHYRGRPLLSWWEGRIVHGFGHGEGVIVDSSYREVARVRAANGRQMDLHEFVLTSRGTALFTCYPEAVKVDLSSIGGPRDATVLQGILQEVDVHSGRLLLEWRSLEHIPVSESYPLREKRADYLHLNSIDVMPDGNLLVSARHTWALYKLDRHTGDVLWRLGGKRSDFRMGRGAKFAWQHDATMVNERLITVFDNGTAGETHSHSQSRGLALDVDTSRKRVSVRHAYHHPAKPLVANALGSVQALPGGHVLVGWGAKPT